MDAQVNQERWLVRTARNVIQGPFSREEVCGLIQQGKFEIDDEVCRGNNYWIFLYEREEVKAQLGIEVPQNLKNNDEEVTQPDAAMRRTQLIEPKAQQAEPKPSPQQQPSAMAAMGAAAPAGSEMLAPPREVFKEPVRPARETSLSESKVEITQVFTKSESLPEFPEFEEEELKEALAADSDMQTNRALREFQAPKNAPAAQPQSDSRHEPTHQQFFTPQVSPEEESGGRAWLWIALGTIVLAGVYGAMQLLR